MCQSQTHTVRHDTSKHRTKVVGNIGLIFHAQKDGVPFTQRFCCIFLHWFDEIFPYKVYVVPAFASFLHFIFLSFLSPPQKNSPLVPFSVFIGSCLPPLHSLIFLATVAGGGSIIPNPSHALAPHTAPPCEAGLGLRHCLLAAELQSMTVSLVQEGDLVPRPPGCLVWSAILIRTSLFQVLSAVYRK